MSDALYNLQTDGLVLYGCGSPNVFKVQLMLSETGLAHEFRRLPLYGDALADPEFRRLNPNGRLPLLVDGGRAIAESGAILIHLAERTGLFLPADPAERSQVFQWLMWQMAGVGPMFGQALHFRYISPDGNAYSKTRYDREVNRLYDVMEARLNVAPWLGGQSYSIADIAAFPWIARYPKTLDVNLSVRPRVADWIARIEARPAFKSIDEEGKRLFKADLASQRNATQAELDRFYGR